MKLSRRQINILIFLAGLLLFVPFLGAVHLFDWDEINFAECAREMIVAKNYLIVTIHYLPFWEKPPLFIWMQVLSMKTFGINEFAARLPDAICGIASLLLVFNIGYKLYGKRFGMLWALAFAGSFLPHFYFKSGIIDPWFNFFIFSSLYFIVLFTNPDKTKSSPIKHLILAALFISLGIMTKGPVAILILSLCIGIYWILQRFKPIISFPQILLFLLAVVIIGGAWFFVEILTGHYNIIVEFIQYQIRLLRTGDAGHGGPFYYHFVVLLIGCFPASVFAIRGFTKNTIDSPFQRHFKTWMVILFWVVLILFSIVKTKIVHYSSLCYFPLTFLAAFAIFKILNDELTWKKWMGWLLGIIGGLIGIALASLQFINKYKQQIIASHIIKDPFANANLQAQVHWSGFEFLIGLLFMIGIFTMLFMIKYRKYHIGFVGLFVISLLTVNLSALIIAPKIEQYSQDAAIRFYQGLQGKDCYVATLGYKSYAQLFYARTQPQPNPKSNDTHWLLTGNIDKPAYFACKITQAKRYQKDYPQLHKLYSKNGFVFFERKPSE